ncbi:Thioredoxin domain-containing protein 3, partial [Coemansia sp. RSA 2603]
SGPRNAVHGSDSAESALRELSFFFFPRIQQQQEDEEPQSESQNPSAVEASEQATIEAAPVASTAGDDDEKKKKKRNKKSKRNNKRKQTVSSVGGDIASVSKTAETTTTTTAVQSDNSDKEAIPLAEEKPEDVAIEGSASENTGSNIHEASVDSISSESLEVQVPAAEEHAISEQPGEQAITEQNTEPVAEIISETAVETVDERAVETVTETVAESVADKVSEPAAEQTAKDSEVPIITQSAEPAVSPVEDSMDATLAKQVDESVDEPEVESNTEQIDMPPSVPADTLEPARELLVPFESTNERTFGLIKPDAYPRYYKQIITQAIERGFTVVVQEEIQLTTEAAEEIYRDMSAYPVFPRIINSVTSGPSLALVLEGIDAISAWRSLVGPTNPRTAKIEARSSLRAKYGMDAQKNAVHASKDENDAIKSVNAVFFSLLEGNFQKLQPTDDPLAMTVSSQHNSDIGSAQTTPLAVPAATIPEEQHTTPVEDTAAETAQTDNTAEALVSSDIPVVTEEPIAADIPSILNTAEETEAPLSVDDPVVQQEPTATSDSAVLDDSVVLSQNTPVGETSVADESAASEPPASSEVLSSLVEQISAESHMIDKEEPAFCADEPVTETLEPAAKIALVEDSTNVKPITEEKPTETKTTVTPQSKSSTVEKSIPFGNRLASSPFLQADRQLSQEANGVAKVVGRIKSPFLSNEKSDGSLTSTSTAAATIAGSINSPPKSVAAIRNAFAKVPEAKVDESSRGLRIDHSPSIENTAEIAVNDSQLETKCDRPVTAKESEKADDVSADDREAKVAASVDKTTTIDDTVEQSTEPSTEATANADDATAIVEETKKPVDEDASKETAKKTVTTTAKDTSTPTKTQAPTKTQTPTKALVTPQSRTVASRPAPSTATASKTPVRKTTTSAAATSSPARSVASSTQDTGAHNSNSTYLIIGGISPFQGFDFIVNQRSISSQTSND